ncbi:MAG TPA: hypothetical protein VFX80_01065 [Solirubrobacteraceae bacterium]|nr:hypothetical protein [Solirubrobacteraceae bacterium]
MAEAKQSATSAPAAAAKAPETMEDSPTAEPVALHEEGNRLLDAPHEDGKVVRKSSVLDSDGYVKQDVYEEVQTPLARRKSYRLAYVKGQQLSREQSAALKG